MERVILTHGGRWMWLAQVQADEWLDEAADMAVAAALASFHNSRDGQTNPSIPAIAKKAKTGLNKTRRALQRLAARGHIEPIAQKGTSTHYTLRLEEPDAAPAPTPAREATPTPARYANPSRTGVRKPLVKTSIENPPPLAEKAEEICLAEKRCGTEAPATPSEFTPEQRRILTKHLCLYDTGSQRFTLAQTLGDDPALPNSDALKWQILRAVDAGHLTA